MWVYDCVNMSTCVCWYIWVLQPTYVVECKGTLPPMYVCIWVYGSSHCLDPRVYCRLHICVCVGICIYMYMYVHIYGDIFMYVLYVINVMYVMFVAYIMNVLYVMHGFMSMGYVYPYICMGLLNY